MLYAIENNYKQITMNQFMENKLPAKIGLFFGAGLLISSLIINLFPSLINLCGYCKSLQLKEFNTLIITLGLVSLVYSFFLIKTKKDKIKILKGTIILLLVIFCFIAVNKKFDQDSIEHLHVAWRISQGDVVYQDFIEFHTNAGKVGEIDSNGLGTVNYNAFTGSHYGWSEEKFDYGMLVVLINFYK